MSTHPTPTPFMICLEVFLKWLRSLSFFIFKINFHSTKNAFKTVQLKIELILNDKGVYRSDFKLCTGKLKILSAFGILSESFCTGSSAEL